MPVDCCLFELMLCFIQFRSARECRIEGCTVTSSMYEGRLWERSGDSPDGFRGSICKCCTRAWWKFFALECPKKSDLINKSKADPDFSGRLRKASSGWRSDFESQNKLPKDEGAEAHDDVSEDVGTAGVDEQSQRLLAAASSSQGLLAMALENITPKTVNSNDERGFELEVPKGELVEYHQYCLEHPEEDPAEVLKQAFWCEDPWGNTIQAVRVVIGKKGHFPYREFRRNSALHSEQHHGLNTPQLFADQSQRVYHYATQEALGGTVSHPTFGDARPRPASLPPNAQYHPEGTAGIFPPSLPATPGSGVGGVVTPGAWGSAPMTPGAGPGGVGVKRELEQEDDGDERARTAGVRGLKRVAEAKAKAEAKKKAKLDLEDGPAVARDRADELLKQWASLNESDAVNDLAASIADQCPCLMLLRCVSCFVF